MKISPASDGLDKSNDQESKEAQVAEKKQKDASVDGVSKADVPVGNRSNRIPNMPDPAVLQGVNKKSLLSNLKIKDKSLKSFVSVKVSGDVKDVGASKTKPEDRMEKPESLIAKKEDRLTQAKMNSLTSVVAPVQQGAKQAEHTSQQPPKQIKDEPIKSSLNFGAAKRTSANLAVKPPVSTKPNDVKAEKAEPLESTVQEQDKSTEASKPEQRIKPATKDIRDITANRKMKAEESTVEPAMDAGESNWGLEAANEDVLMLTPSNFVPVERSKMHDAISIGCLVLTGVWVGYCLFYGAKTFSFSDMSALAPQELGGFLAALLIPPMILWTVFSNMRRDNDVQQYAQSLRHELQSIIFPSEEKTQRASKDIQVLSQQAAELSMASKDTLRNLAKARQGMRAEIRDFVGLSKKAEFHIDRLSEVLQGKTKRLSVIMDSIDERTSGIDANTERGVNAWQRASEKMFSSVGEIEARLTQGVEGLEAAASRTDEKALMVEERFKNTAGRFDTVLDGVVVRMNDVSNDFDIKKVEVEGLSEKLLENAAQFATKIQDQKDGFEEAAVKATESLTISLERIQDQYASLDQNAQDIASQTDEIVQRVESSVDSLAETSEDIRGKVEIVKEALVSQTEGLKESVVGLTNNIDKIEVAGDNAAHKLAEVVDVALSGSDRLTLSIRRAVDNLYTVSTAAKSNADDCIRVSEEQLARIEQAREMHETTSSNVADTLNDTYDKLGSIGSFVDEQVDKLSEAFDGEVVKFDESSRALTRRLAALQYELKSPLSSLREALDDVKEEHESFVGVFDERIVDLESVSDKAITSADYIKTMLREEVVEVSTLTGQLNNDADIIASKLGENANLLRQEVSEAVEKLDGVTNKIDEKSDVLRDVANNNVKSLQDVESAVEKSCSDVRLFVTETLDSLESLDGGLTLRAETVRTETEKSREALKSIIDSFERSLEIVAPGYDDLLDRAGNTALRFKTLHGDFEEQTQTYLEWFKDAGIVFDGALERIVSGTEKVTEDLRDSSTELMGRFDEVGDKAEESLRTVKSLDSALDSQQSNIHLVIDSSVAKIKAMQKDMNDHVEETAATMSQSMSQIKNVLATVDETSDDVKELSEASVEAFAKVEKTMVVKSDVLTALTKDFEGKTSGFFDDLDLRSSRFTTETKDHFLSLQRVSDSFSIRLKELERHINSAVDNSKAYTADLKSESQNVSNMTMDVTEKVGAALSSLSTKVGSVQQLSRAVALDITAANKTLAEQSDSLLRVSSKVEQAASDVSEQFLKQTDKLFDIVEQARTQTEDMKTQTSRVQRDQFMNSAKFIVESLHSLSVDLTRLIDGKVSERIWKSYQAGDVSAFTERLAALDMGVVDEKLRHKYEEDHEFRNYVQKFIRQYEELNMQALDNDYGDLLASTFRSSDVGKLYTLLYYAAGRDKKAA